MNSRHGAHNSILYKTTVFVGGSGPETGPTALGCLSGIAVAQSDTAGTRYDPHSAYRRCGSGGAHCSELPPFELLIISASGIRWTSFGEGTKMAATPTMARTRHMYCVCTCSENEDEVSYRLV